MLNLGPSGLRVAVGGGVAVGASVGLGVGVGVGGSVAVGTGVGIGTSVGVGVAVGVGLGVGRGTRVGVGVRIAITGFLVRTGVGVTCGVGTRTGVIGVLVTVGAGRVLVCDGEKVGVRPAGNAVAVDEPAQANAPNINNAVTITFVNNLPVRIPRILGLTVRPSIKQVHWLPKEPAQRLEHWNR